MLEDNLRTLFTLEAEADQPPSSISVPAAGRSARVRRRLQRALTIGSPVLAAAAVTAVIITSVALVGGGAKTPRPARPTVPSAIAIDVSVPAMPVNVRPDRIAPSGATISVNGR